MAARCANIYMANFRYSNYIRDIPRIFKHDVNYSPIDHELGLDDCMYLYAHPFINNNVTGKSLLNMTVDDLSKLHVEKLGHQEVILEALENLRNLHHNLDTENLQYVCLRLSCKARSLCNEIRIFGPPLSPQEPGHPQVKQSVSTSTMTSVADVLDSLWMLISWLDRPPFNPDFNGTTIVPVPAPLIVVGNGCEGGGGGTASAAAANPGPHKQPRSELTEKYSALRNSLLRIAIELATNAQRDTFAEKPINVILDCCTLLDELSDNLIREASDPLILQPASLEFATVKRRQNSEDEDFGLVFEPLPLNGVHIISEVRFQSPAHLCSKIEPGDEVVQINYQTVVGWAIKRVLQLMEENPSEVIITLKKRPRHLPVYGQIYMKPFRIPARTQKKGGLMTFNNLPSPRAELLVAPNITLKITKYVWTSKTFVSASCLLQFKVVQPNIFFLVYFSCFQTF